MTLGGINKYAIRGVYNIIKLSKEGEYHMENMQSHNNCKNCGFRQKHPTMQNTSLCLNRDSEHYGSFIDERHPDYESKNEECFIMKPLT